MNDNHELQRTWRERAKWLSGTLIFSLVGHYVSYPTSVCDFLGLLALLLFFTLSAWGTWQSFSKPDARIVSGRIYLFGLPLASPVVISDNEIRAIKRHMTTPILRVPPLVFYLASGRAIKFSTGTSENRMKRIISFLETELGLKIEISRTGP